MQALRRFKPLAIAGRLLLIATVFPISPKAFFGGAEMKAAAKAAVPADQTDVRADKLGYDSMHVSLVDQKRPAATLPTPVQKQDSPTLPGTGEVEVSAAP